MKYLCMYVYILYVYFIDYTVLSQYLVVMTRCDQVVADLDIVYMGCLAGIPTIQSERYVL